MGWWPFGTSTPNAPSKQPPVSDSDADSSRGGPVVAVNPKVADGLQHQPAIEPEPRDEPLSKPNVTLKRSSESWDYITQNIKPKIWSNGVSECVWLHQVWVKRVLMRILRCLCGIFWVTGGLFLG